MILKFFKVHRFMTGINLDAAYKGWDLQMFWQGVLKRDWWPGDKNMTFWGVTDGEWGLGRPCA